MILRSIMATALVASSIYAMTNVELNKYKENSLLKADNIKFIAGKEIGNGFAMIKGYVDVPQGISPLNVITNNEVVITGGVVFDAKTKKKITIDIDYEKFKQDAAYTIGNGKKDLFVFTEAECPYCVRFEENIKNLKPEYKLHVFMFPLEQMHYFAKDMAYATLSQPIEKRAEYYKKLMKLQKEDTTLLLKELRKYSVDVYKKVLIGFNSFSGTNNRSSQLAQKYMKYFEKETGKKFAGVADVVTYCNSKIKEFESDKTRMDILKKVDAMYKKQNLFATAYMGVSGTPTVKDMNGEQFNSGLLFNKK